MSAVASPCALGASIQNQYRDGSTLNVFLLLSLPVGFDTRTNFREIVAVVHTATQSRHSDWRREGPEIWITVVSPQPENDADKQMIFNAVCEGAGRIIPRSSINWCKR